MKNTKQKTSHIIKQLSSDGFTLIELLIVIAIVGILAGVIILALNNARIEGRDAKRAGDMKQMLNAMEQYHITHNVYPTGTASMETVSGGNGIVLNDPGAVDGTEEPFIPNYVPLMPESPSPADGNCVDGSGRGHNNYWYDVADDGSNFTVTFCLGKTVGGWPEGIHIATPEGIQ
jgi:prepilin-type N-terminal cleavage/methylation domain-containing protein